MGRRQDVTTSLLASMVRNWRGTNASRAVPAPEVLPELYEREGCPRSRLVREALSELNLDYVSHPVPESGARQRQALLAASGREDLPFLVDPNTQREVAGAGEINRYLFDRYLAQAVPGLLRENQLNLAASRLATKIRGDRGIRYRPAATPAQLLELYSFESSPYTRLVRECLSELGISYVVRQLGKQQMADMGPPNMRWHLGKYQPLPDTRRAWFLDKYGEVQVPFLVDPNTSTEMFESADIIRYLNETYGSAPA